MSDPIEALLSKPGLGPALIQELRALCPALPDEGIVAGQSVASLLLHRLGRTGPVNDIDVFVIRPLAWGNELHAKARRQYAPIAEIGCAADEIYAETLVNTHREFLARIGPVTRDGMLNRIEYQVDAEDGCDVLALIAGNFDLNCVQVGIDLATGRLSFTEAFRQYLVSDQLFIANGQTPISSLARLARKAEQLGAYCDFEAEGRFAAACALLFGAGSGCEQAADYVGEKTYGKIGPQLPFLEQWFHLAPLSALPRDEDGCYRARFDSANGRGAPFRLYRAHLAAPLETAILERPSSCPAIGIERGKGFVTATLAGKPLGLMEFSVVDRMFRQGAVSKRKLAKLHTVLTYAKRPALVACLVNPLLYVRDNVSEESVEELNRFFGEHPGIARNLTGISHEEQLRIKRALRGREKRGQRWAVGAVETAHLWLDGPVGPIIARDGLDAFIKNFETQAKMTVAGVLPEAVTRVPLFEITRIATSAALYAEGDRMDHCVGGYASLLAVPGHYFFSIQFRLGSRSGNRSMLYAFCDARSLVCQHMSERNTPPRLVNVVAGIVLMERMRDALAGRRRKDWSVVATALSREFRKRWDRYLLRRGVDRRDWRPYWTRL
jgi:hypothetical protein